MKKIVLLSGIDETVIFPVFQSVTKDIAKNINLARVPIANKDNTLLEKNNGATTIDKNLHNTYLQVNYQIEPMPEVEAYRVPIHPDSKPFFKDDDARVKMVTSFRSAKINFEINVKSKSKSTISKVIDLLYHRKLDIDTFDKHNIQISYVVPTMAKKLMLEVFNIKKKYNDLELSKYLESCLDKKQVDLALSLTGNDFKNSLIVKEYQVDVIGEFIGEFDKMETDKEDLYYVLPLNYQITIQRPLAVHLVYPYIIYNERLTEAFRDKYYKPLDVNVRNHEDSLHSLLKRYDSFGISKSGYYLKYPSYDEHQINHKLSSYTTIMTLLAKVELSDPYELFNIKHLPKIKFKESILNIILENRENISKYLKGLFYFNLYVNEDEIKSDCLVLDEEGNLRTTFPMDIKNTYRVGIHLCDNLSSISNSSRYTIKEYINKEIYDNQDKIRKLSDFGIESQKVSIRINDNKLGEEVYKTEDLFFDIYLELFDVDKDIVTNTINNFGTTQSAGEILFKIKVPDYNWPKLSSVHHVKIFRLFEE